VTRERLYTALAGLNGAVAIAAAAYGAHGTLEPHAAELLDKAYHFQLLHAVALLALVRMPGRANTAAAALFLIGICCFCGGLYATALLEWPPWLVPFGGTSFILGWLAIALGAIWRGRTEVRP